MTSAWQASLDTPWTKRIRPHFQDRVRLLGSGYTRQGAPGSSGCVSLGRVILGRVDVRELVAARARRAGWPGSR
ncbi:MAG: hypothetical protein WDO24_05525 [Pseudomonadota bacterium]